uniref:Uncharacterized protein LOC111104356 isoform X1 n=1 Tax=Crassostrea virginica TaxID=6565 RepID=A0A8B8AR77_CRAVI|nr:uncharacterized protein LOC111104356 isoform X1 [Crassostrea virginica]
MDLHGNLILSFLAVLLISKFLIMECRKIDGYKFPVYSTDVCPRNETEWNKRAAVFNCTGEDSTYACFPNDDITQLIEFCYPLQVIAIPPDLCLFLSKNTSKVDAFDCKTRFKHGCPDKPYRGSTIFKYPSCISIGNGCFLAEPFCESSSKPDTSPDNSTSLHRKLNDDGYWIGPLLGIIPACILGCLVMALIFLDKKKKHNKRKMDEEKTSDQEGTSLFSDENGVHLTDEEGKNEGGNRDEENTNDHEATPLLLNQNTVLITHGEENQCESDTLDGWQHDDKMFVQTTASENVENLIKSKNLVIVAGHSGCGKTVIARHVALKYRESGWVVKPVDKVGEIKKAYTSGRFKQNKTMFVLDDPIGKEYLSEILHTKWKKYEETLSTFLKNVKLVITCRTGIIFDTRVKGLFQERSNIVVVDDNQNKLSYSEKKIMLKKYTTSEDISEADILKILQNDKVIYFPLLCKLFASDRKHVKNVLQFFTEPINVLKEEIENCKEKDKEKYCGLVCLVLFNNKLSQNDLIECKTLFRKCLNLCGVWDLLPPITLIKHLELLEGFFVKQVCNNYHFYHDFVMEVTSYVFGTEYPKEMLEHADIGFLQRRVRLKKCTDCPFTITLSDPHINDLAIRLSEDIFKDRFLEVVLNPCLRNEEVTDRIIERMKKNEKALQMILKGKTMKCTERDADSMWKDNWFSRLDFVNLLHEISPLSALIVFRHDKLARFFLDSLKKEIDKLSEHNIFSAICCNGSKDFFDLISKRKVSECLRESKSVLHPIHIVSIFNNHTLLSEIVKQNVDVNMNTNSKNAWTPLTLAAANKLEERVGQLLSTSKDKTLKILLYNGADINLPTKNGISPLYIACQNGHESTVKILLDKGAEVNLCTKNGASPLFVSCQNGHDEMVRMLLENGADVNVCNNTGASSLLIACQNGNKTAVKFLLNNGADINLCDENGNSPLIIACRNGREGIVRLLLEKSAKINLCNKRGASPLYTACEIGYEITAKTLLDNDAEINLCTENENSPLYIASQNGYSKTVELLLKNHAEVNLCNKTGASPLYAACEKGHEGIVQLLLKNGANVNLCNIIGESPLYKACENGHYSTVQILLEQKADVNLCTKEKSSPLFIASKNGHGRIEILLLQEIEENRIGFGPF